MLHVLVLLLVLSAAAVGLSVLLAAVLFSAADRIGARPRRGTETAARAAAMRRHPSARATTIDVRA